jgi:hypothetical protein
MESEEVNPQVHTETPGVLEGGTAGVLEGELNGDTTAVPKGETTGELDVETTGVIEGEPYGETTGVSEGGLSDGILQECPRANMDLTIMKRAQEFSRTIMNKHTQMIINPAKMTTAAVMTRMSSIMRSQTRTSTIQTICHHQCR